MKRHLRNTGVLLAAMMLAAPNLAQDTGPDRRGQDRPQRDRPQRDRPQRDQAQQQQRRLRVPDSVQYMPDIVYSTAPGTPGADGADGEPVELLMDVAFPKQSNNQPLPAVVYIHGGGWVIGDRRIGTGLILQYAQGGYFAATIEYRLADVAPFPAAVHDCKAAIRFLRANAQKLGIDPDRIGVFGRSSGAHLAGLIAFSGNDEALEGDLEPADISSQVRCVVTSSARVEFMTLSERQNPDGPEERFLGTDPETFVANAEAASLLTYIDPDDPPILLLHGTADRVVPFEQARMFRSALEEAGIESKFLFVEDGAHTNLGSEARIATAEWLDAHLAGHATTIVRARETTRGRPRRGKN